MPPSETTLKTKPRALICAATQPKYETTIQRVTKTSTVRPYFSLKKSPIVSIRRLYKWRAKKSPTKIRHIEDPKGSETIPPSPSFRKVAGIPKTVSEPNQVANTVAVTIGNGRLCPAAAKSAVFLTRNAAQRPIPTDITQ